jgi:hypothetical protein
MQKDARYLASNDPRHYEVQAGDNPWSIVQKLFPEALEDLLPLLTQQLMARNNIRQPEYLQIGAVLMAPDGTEEVSYSKADFERDVERLEAQRTAQLIEGSRYSGLVDEELEEALAGMGARQQQVNEAARLRAESRARFRPGYSSWSGDGLSPEHSEIQEAAMLHPPEESVGQWNSARAAGYALGQNIFPFKDQWVKGYRDAIVAAADRYDLPPELLAGVAHIEVGGDPLFVDDFGASRAKGI